MVSYKGSKYPVLTSICFPYVYPDVPCIIKIINPDQNRFRVNDHYAKGIQQDGTVYVTLSEIMNWG
jgi:hypothetical protein